MGDRFTSVCWALNKFYQPPTVGQNAEQTSTTVLLASTSSSHPWYIFHALPRLPFNQIGPTLSSWPPPPPVVHLGIFLAIVRSHHDDLCLTIRYQAPLVEPQEPV